MDTKEGLLGSNDAIEAKRQSPEKSWIRFSVFIWFSVAIFMNSLPGEIYVPIAGYVQDIYGTSETIMTLATTSYMLMHPILSIPSSQLIVKAGWAQATKLGVFLTIVGSAMKLLVDNTGFWIIIGGQFVIGAGKPLILNSQGEMAANWFKAEARQTLFTILNMFNVVSNIVTMMIPAKWIYLGYDEKLDAFNYYGDGKDRFLKLQWVMFFISLTMIPCFIFLYPNSKFFHPQTSSLAQSFQNYSMKDNLKRVLQRKEFIKCLVSYSIYIGVLKSVGIILPYMFKAFGFQAGVVALAGAHNFIQLGSCVYIGSFISQMLIMIFASKANSSKKLLISCLMIASALTEGLLYASLSTGESMVVYANIAIIGFAAMPIVPLMMDIACDIVPKSTSSYAIGIMYIGSQLNVVMFSQIFSVAIGGSQSTRFRVLLTLGLVVSCFVVGFLVFCLIRLKKPQQIHSITSPRSRSSLLEKYQFFNFASDWVQISILESERSKEAKVEQSLDQSELVHKNEPEQSKKL